MIYNYVKKPPKVQAIQYYRKENLEEVKQFAKEAFAFNPLDNQYYVDSPKDGLKKCCDGDYVVKLPDGSFKAVKPNDFDKTYKKAESD